MERCLVLVLSNGGQDDGEDVEMGLNEDGGSGGRKGRAGGRKAKGEGGNRGEGVKTGQRRREI